MRGASQPHLLRGPDNKVYVLKFRNHRQGNRILAWCPQKRVYLGIASMESFHPWLTRLESLIDSNLLKHLAGEIPAECAASDFDGLLLILEQRDGRRLRARQLLASLRGLSPAAFPDSRDATEADTSMKVVTAGPRDVSGSLRRKAKAAEQTNWAEIHVRTFLQGVNI
jgi:hypothetical protein